MPARLVQFYIFFSFVIGSRFKKWIVLHKNESYFFIKRLQIKIHFDEGLMLSVSAFQFYLKFALINSFQNLILFFTDAELQFF